MSSIVHVVHCIDTEGPLYESLEATFDRIKQIWGFELEPSNKNLELLRKKKINLKGFEDEIANLEKILQTCQDNIELFLKHDERKNIIFKKLGSEKVKRDHNNRYTTIITQQIEKDNYFYSFKLPCSWGMSTHFPGSYF